MYSFKATASCDTNGCESIVEAESEDLLDRATEASGWGLYHSRCSQRGRVTHDVCPTCLKLNPHLRLLCEATMSFSYAR
jgi:hypothetical protein